MRKKKKFHTKEKLQKSVVKNKEKAFIPHSEEYYENIESESWFDINETVNKADKNVLRKETSTYYTRKFLFYPSDEQKEILNEWFDKTTILYNETLKILKERKYFSSKKDKPSFYSIRSLMFDKKKEIQESCINKIHIHTLDLTIKKCVENYKALLTNYRRKNISHFRARYYKTTNYNRRTIYFEPSSILKNNEISNLGKINIYDDKTKNGNNVKFKKEEIKQHFEIKFCNISKKYFINLIYKRKKINKLRKEEFISLDPGVYPFLTGVNKDNAINIGNNIYDEISKKVKLLEKGEQIESERKKKKYLLRLKRKLRNKIDDLHWKTINYLTNYYNKIILGDLSVKKILVKNNVRKETKKVFSKLNYYTFKRRLELKCKEKNVEYKEINEFYTSKTCSLCGNYNEKLGMNKKYNCENCKITINRDVNGARCIYFVSLI